MPSMNFTERNRTQYTFTDNEIVVTFKKPVTMQSYMTAQKTFSVKYDRNIIGEKMENLTDFVVNSLKGIYDKEVVLSDVMFTDKICENIEKIEIVITQ